MSDYLKIPTTPEVAAVIRARHGSALKCFESFSDCYGTFNGADGTVGRVETGYGFEGATHPILYCKTTWIIDPDKPHHRIEETHTYWICCANWRAE